MRSYRSRLMPSGITTTARDPVGAARRKAVAQEDDDVGLHTGEGGGQDDVVDGAVRSAPGDVEEVEGIELLIPCREDPLPECLGKKTGILHLGIGWARYGHRSASWTASEGWGICAWFVWSRGFSSTTPELHDTSIRRDLLGR